MTAEPTEDHALQYLEDIFGFTIESCVIETVLESCGGNVLQTADALAKLSISYGSVQPGNCQMKIDEQSTASYNLPNVAIIHNNDFTATVQSTSLHDRLYPIVSETPKIQIEETQPNKCECQSLSSCKKIEKLNIQLQKIVQNDQSNLFQLSYIPSHVPPVMRSSPLIAAAADQTTTHTILNQGEAYMASGLQINNEHVSSSALSKNFKGDNQQCNFNQKLLERDKLCNESEYGLEWVEPDNSKDTTSLKQSNSKSQGMPDLRELSSASRHQLELVETYNIQDQFECQELSTSVPGDVVHNVTELKHTIFVKNVSSTTSVDSGDHQVNNSKFRIINAKARDINVSYIQLPLAKVCHKVMLDKSTTALEEFNLNLCTCQNADKHFLSFRKIFKQIPVENLRYIFELCGGNVHWASEILLDGTPHAVLASEEVHSSEDDENGSFETCNCLSSYNKMPTVEKPTSVANQETTIHYFKKKKKKVISESSINLKLQIDQNLDFGDHHYSNESLKMKRSRHPYKEEIDERSIYYPTSWVEPSTSQQSSIRQFDEEPTDLYVSGGQDLQYSLPSYEDYCPATEVEHSSPSYEDCCPAIKVERSSPSYKDYCPAMKDIIELHTDQIDSQIMYTEIILREDKELARQLIENEAELDRAGQKPEVPNLSEIMDMQRALSLVHRDAEKWKMNQSTDMAARLTRLKLYNLFPEIDEDFLSEVLEAHNNNFQQTVEDLLVSIGEVNILAEKNGINKFVMKRDLERQRQVLEQAKRQTDEEWPALGEGAMPTQRTVDGYREQARKHLEHRNFNHEKAKHYFNHSKTDAASYHIQLADYHKQQFLQFNSRAASTLIKVQAADKSNKTLDLHSFFVPDAVQALDLYLDHHIKELKSSGAFNKTLVLITGRGVHSLSGPRIKPAVMRRLAQRGLKYSEVSPGVLAVGINMTNRLTDQHDEPVHCH